MISHKRLREILHYDPDTGAFTWLIPHGRWGRIPAGVPAGIRCESRGRPDHIRITLAGVDYAAHRLAFLYMLGEFPKTKTVDHKNNDPFDNRWENLRPASTAQNGANRAAYSKSGHKWAYPARGGWSSLITTNGKQKYLGRFNTPEEASARAFEYAKEVFGDFARK